VENKQIALDARKDCSSADWALLRIGMERKTDSFGELVTNAALAFANIRRARQNLTDYRTEITAGGTKRRRARNHLVENHTTRVNVGRERNRLTP